MTRRYLAIADCTCSLPPGATCREWRCRYSLVPEVVSMPGRALVEQGVWPREAQRWARAVLSDCRPWSSGGRVDYLAQWDDEDREDLVDALADGLGTTCALDVASADGYAWPMAEDRMSPDPGHAPSRWVADVLGLSRQGVSLIELDAVRGLVAAGSCLRP